MIGPQPRISGRYRQKVAGIARSSLITIFSINDLSNLGYSITNFKFSLQSQNKAAKPKTPFCFTLFAIKLENDFTRFSLVKAREKGVPWTRPTNLIKEARVRE